MKTWKFVDSESVFSKVISHPGDFISENWEGEEDPEGEELISLGSPNMDPSFEIVEVTVEDEERAQGGAGNNIQDDEDDGADEDEPDDVIETVTEDDGQENSKTKDDSNEVDH